MTCKDCRYKKVCDDTHKSDYYINGDSWANHCATFTFKKKTHKIKYKGIIAMQNEHGTIFFCGEDGVQFSVPCMNYLTRRKLKDFIEMHLIGLNEMRKYEDV